MYLHVCIGVVWIYAAKWLEKCNQFDKFGLRQYSVSVIQMVCFHNSIEIYHKSASSKTVPSDSLNKTSIFSTILIMSLESSPVMSCEDKIDQFFKKYIIMYFCH